MSGRHRSTFNIRRVGFVAAAVALVVISAGTWLSYQQSSDVTCGGEVRLTVAAAPEIAPAVQQAAKGWTDGGVAVSDTCVAVDVVPINPATVASAVSDRHGVSLTGLGQTGGETVPDVWIPDSSTWLLRLKQEASGFTPTDGLSIAQSPVVVAMPQPIAQTLGWSDRKPGWTDLLTTINAGGGLRAGIVDPTKDAAGLSGLLALGADIGAGPAGKNSTAGALRALATGSSALRADLMEKFPKSSNSVDIAGSLSVALLSEEDVVAYNAKRPSVGLAALYLDPLPPPLDYPYAVMPEANALQAAAAAGLHGVLALPGFKDALASAGLRGPDGTVGTGFTAPLGAPLSSAAPTPAASGVAEDGVSGAAPVGRLDPSVISRTLDRWATVTLPGRVLAVFDVSGSMGAKMPKSGGRTRAQVMQDEARRGLTLLDDRWAVGVWIFSTRLKGSRDWAEIVPISPLNSLRGDVLASIDRIVPKPNGATGLYDTALAAYRRVQDTWEAGRVNSVILFTDGKNVDDKGLKRGQLVAKLKATADVKRPVRMIIAGIGPEVDPKELKAITDATGGGVFTTADPEKIGDIFLKAISSRPGPTR